MRTIDFVVRTSAGGSQKASIPADKNVYVLDAGSGQEISLNLRQSDIRSYNREGRNLEVVLADGRIIILEGYFGADGAAESRLFISSDGYLNEVTMIETADGSVYAQYGPTEQWGKWSPAEDLIFLDGTDVAVAAGGEEDVSMLGAGLLGGSGLLGALGLGAAGVGAAAIASSGGGGSGGGGTLPTGSEPTDPDRIEPTINEPGPIVIGGDDVDTATETITITGTAEPGSTVVVNIGGETVETVSDEDGNWAVDFSGETFPQDGDYTVTATVTETNGTQTDLTGPNVVIDTTGPDTSVTEGTVSVDEVINAAEYEAGILVSGTGEPGASVLVSVEGVEHQTTVSQSGTWSVTYAAGELPTGEYTTQVVVVSTDSFGNSTTVTDSMQIDTIPHDLTINTSTVETDGTINFVENSDGFTLTGTSAPGAQVTVEVQGVTQTVTVASNGVWSADFAAGTLPGGEYDATVTASTVDAAGNPSSTTGTIRIDTEVRNFRQDPYDLAVASDGSDVINNQVASSGFEITGTVEQGSTVMVTVGGVTQQATVDANGNWTAAFGGGVVGTGERDLNVRVDVTDPAGNTDSLSDTIRLDTLVNELSQDSTPVEGDNVVNAAEAADGVQITGQVEPGSTVQLQAFGQTYAAVVASDGSWTVDIPGGDIPVAEMTANMVITATDAAGNTSSITEQLTLDLVAPEQPDLVGGFRETGGGYRSVTTETSDDAVTIHQVDTSGNVSEMAVHASADAFLGETDYYFLDGAGAPQSIPDGSELIITNTDDAGNASSTYVVLDETATTSVNVGNLNLNGFNIDEIDLGLGDNRELTITEQQLIDLSDNGDQLVVRGGSDDTVNISGAQSAGTTNIDGETFNVYTLGTDGATIIVDDEINVVT